jgi:5-methylcytosine-specific restriction endonuclease McrA
MNARKAARLTAIERDGRACQLCRGTDQITTHHRIPRHLSRNDRAANLVTVCRACHDVIEELDRLPAALDWLPYLIKGDTQL